MIEVIEHEERDDFVRELTALLSLPHAEVLGFCVMPGYEIDKGGRWYKASGRRYAALVRHD